MVCGDCPGTFNTAMPSSVDGRSKLSTPSERIRYTPVTAVAPGSSSTTTGTFKRRRSHAASRFNGRKSFGPVTRTPLTSRCGGWSSIEASIARQTVKRVHDMSTFFEDQLRRRSSIVRIGFEECMASVMRLRAMEPSKSFDRFAGASFGHQATTGASGTNSGITNVSGW